ncbi:unnamed protein product [Gadus morhua 'NCC']
MSVATIRSKEQLADRRWMLGSGSSAGSDRLADSINSAGHIECRCNDECPSTAHPGSSDFKVRYTASETTIRHPTLAATHGWTS